MTRSLGHEACSELLRPYVRGGLGAPEAAAVRDHLASCSACEEERRAVAALLEEEPEPLSEAERARLRDAVLARAGGVEERASGGRAEAASPWWGRLVPALAAAAVIALAAVTIPGLLTGSERAGDAEGARDGRTRGGKPPEAAPEVSIEPRFHADLGTITTADLRTLGTDPAFRRFGKSHTARDVDDRLEEQTLARLEAIAPSAAADRIRDCVAPLLDGAGDGTLPVLGATGTFEGRDAVVVGFLSEGAAGRDLDRYGIWVWSAASCEVLTSISGGVGTR